MQFPCAWVWVHVLVQASSLSRAQRCSPERVLMWDRRGGSTGNRVLYLPFFPLCEIGERLHGEQSSVFALLPLLGVVGRGRQDVLQLHLQPILALHHLFVLANVMHQLHLTDRSSTVRCQTKHTHTHTHTHTPKMSATSRFTSASTSYIIQYWNSIILSVNSVM